MDKNRLPQIFSNGIDLQQNEARNLVLHNCTEEEYNNSQLLKRHLKKPSGSIIFDPNSKHAKILVDDLWKEIAFFGEGGSGGGGINPSDVSISQLKDVKTVTLQNGDILVWDEKKKAWTNKKSVNNIIDENDINEIMAN